MPSNSFTTPGAALCRASQALRARKSLSLTLLLAVLLVCLDSHLQPVGAFRLRGKRRMNRAQCNEDPEWCLPKKARPVVTSSEATNATINWTYFESTPINRGPVWRVELRLKEVAAFRYHAYGWIAHTTLLGHLQQHTLTNLRPGRLYRLKIVTSNREGAQTSDAVTFRTKESLKLSCTPAQQTVRVGGDAEFTCEAEGGPKLAVSTQRHLPSSASVQQSPGDGHHRLTIRYHNVQLRQDQTSYCIQAHTTNLRKVSCFQILVQDPVRIRCVKMRQCGRRARTQKKLTVRCNVQGYPMPNVTWYFDGERVTNTRNRSNSSSWRVMSKELAPRNFGRSAVYQHRLRAHSTQNDIHTGQVTIRASNGHSQAEVSQDIIITDRRENASVSLSHGDLFAGNSFSLLCHATIAQSGLKFRWFHRPDGQQAYRLLEPGMGGVHYSNTTSPYHHRLLVPRANMSHSGQYLCKAVNNYGCPAEATTSINIQAPLHASMSSDGGSIFLDLGRPAQINCTVETITNGQLPAVFWTLNGQIISSLSSHRGNQNTQSSWEATSNPIVNNMAESGIAVYQIRTDSLHMSDIGSLECVAQGQERDVIRRDSAVVTAQEGMRVFIDSPVSQQIREGGYVRMTCHIFADRSYYDLDLHSIPHPGWYFRHLGRPYYSKFKPVKHTPGVRVTRKITKTRHGVWLQFSLEINGFFHDKEGAYSCRSPANRVKSSSPQRTWPGKQSTVKLTVYDKHHSDQSPEIIL